MRQLRLNAFDMNCVGHLQQGLWAHPRDRSTEYTSLDYWVSLAQTLERGLFDGIFLADILGVYDIYEGSPAAAIRNAVQVPLGDPLLLVPAMAHATTHLGFGVTCNTTYEPPYLLARRFSTLDHLTRGRIGWNIVTGYLDSAARAAGLTAQIPHDRRYDLADDYMDAVYALWEGSWEDGAVLADRAARIYADPARVHAIHHASELHRIDAIHLCAPSPQRTPLLYQAGASPRGRDFAATHAECVFVNGTTPKIVRGIVDDIRARAVAQGRSPRDVQIFVGITVVTGATDSEAADRLAEYRQYASTEGALAHFSASTGIDFSRYSEDEPIRMVKTDANVSNVEAITTKSEQVWTLRKLREQMSLGGRNPPIVGGPATVADAMQRWMEEADIDGFNLARTVAPECVEDFVRLVVPELQARGIYKTAYAEGTLREKFTGQPRLPSSHRASRFRR